MQSESFAATIKIEDTENGKKAKLVFKSLPWVQHQLKKYKDGEEVSLYVTSQKPKRTEQQNRYYWGAYLPLICEATGYTPDELHTYFKGKYLTRGVKPILGHSVRLTASTTELNKSEFSAFVDAISMETGIMPPDPKNWL